MAAREWQPARGGTQFMRLLLRFLGFLFAAGTTVFLVGVAGVAGMLWHYSQGLPDYSQLQDYEPPVMTRVHAADGSLLAEYAKERRTLDEDIPLDKMGREDRELLLANAALLTHADGELSDSESALIDKLIKLLGFTRDEAQPILDSVADGALQLGSDVLLERED